MALGITYRDSKYWSKLISRECNIFEEESINELMIALDEDLSKEDIAEFVAEEFTFSSELVNENEVLTDEHKKCLIDETLREIEVFKKHGYESIAERGENDVKRARNLACIL